MEQKNVVNGVVVPNNQPIVVQANVVSASPIVVQGQVQGQVVQGQVQADDDNIIAWPGENRFHNDDFERCCKCGPDCAMAWFVPCVSLAHISSKLQAYGTPFCMPFNVILIGGCVLFLIDIIMSASFGSSTNFFRIFCLVCACMMRSAVRRKLNIDGNDCQDCCCAFWCLPCVITQLNGTLWKFPEENPGCNCQDNFAHMV